MMRLHRRRRSPPATLVSTASSSARRTRIWRSAFRERASCRPTGGRGRPSTRPGFGQNSAFPRRRFRLSRAGGRRRGRLSGSARLGRQVHGGSARAIRAPRGDPDGSARGRSRRIPARWQRRSHGTWSWRCCSATLPTLRTHLPLFDDVETLRWDGPRPEFVELAAKLDNRSFAAQYFSSAHSRTASRCGR